MVKTGGQQGHEGSTLAFLAFPDETIAHIPDYCHQCGDDISGVQSIELENRQVIDIPPTDFLMLFWFTIAGRLISNANRQAIKYA